MPRRQRWIVGFQAGSPPDEEALARAGLRVVEYHLHDAGACLLVESAGPLSAETLTRLRSHPGVAYVEADQVIQLPPEGEA
jgi:hypothetical protein